MSRLSTGDYVRPNCPGSALPAYSVWRVRDTPPPFSGIRIEPVAGTSAESAMDRTWQGRFFNRSLFTKVVKVRGCWFDYEDVVGAKISHEIKFDPAVVFDHATERVSSVSSVKIEVPPNSMLAKRIGQQRLADAEEYIRQQRKFEVEANKAKAKADKEAAVRANKEEARRVLSAKLHADRCLGEATLALIAEVSRLNNGGAEQVAAHSIAAHVDQLQALAKSYGYRIAKPSMLAQVVKL